MLYAIMSTDVENSLSKRQSARAEHLQRLEALQAQGRLILAGPHPIVDSKNLESAGFSGSLIVAEFETLGMAKAWADVDPYVNAGVYSQVIVKPFKQVFPK